MQVNMIDQNIVITESCSNLRMLGRNALAGKWKIAIIAMLIYTICMDLPPIIFNSLFGIKISNIFTSDGYTYGLDANLYSEMYNSMPDYCVLSIIYILLISGALQLGQAIFFLASFRKHDVMPTDVFLGFEKFGKALGLFIYQNILITLWTFVFIIPGVIAAYRYSQAFFVLADDPDKSIGQCINESKAMMKGNKMKLFVLQVTFIGWAILAAIPAGVLQSVGQIATSNTFLQAIFAFIGSLFVVPLTVYMLSTYTGFYEILSGHLIKETKPVPVTPQEALQMQKELSIHSEAAAIFEEGKAEADVENEEEEPVESEPDNSSYMPPKQDDENQQ